MRKIEQHNTVWSSKDNMHVVREKVHFEFDVCELVSASEQDDFWMYKKIEVREAEKSFSVTLRTKRHKADDGADVLNHYHHVIRYKKTSCPTMLDAATKAIHSRSAKTYLNKKWHSVIKWYNERYGNMEVL